jgi:predicted nucleic acid-binding protein
LSYFFLDASAVVKRYSSEIGSAWIRTLTESPADHNIVLGEITLAEVAAALAAKHRAPGGTSQQERDEALALFLSHCDSEYTLVTISREVIERAVQLTQSYRLRGYDAVQLATALRLADDVERAPG